MVEGAIDEERLDRDVAALADEVRARLRADGVPDAEITVEAALDCRYVGQGYELRVPLPDGRFDPGSLDRFHVLHEQEYGHAFHDPIEIVNARVTALGARPKVGRLTVGSGTLAEATLGEGESVHRRDGRLESLPTRFLERARLPVDEPIPGPAVVFQRDATVLVPPGWAARADGSGVLVIAR
jgi:N-methylhydantoinase A/oxoprolinase/acetone carboxylase beta subunit